MRRLRQTAWTALVWLTAVSTLTAGIPHVLCRCAGDQGQPVCPGPVPTDGACCCAAPDGPASSACECCQAKSEEPAPEQPGGSDSQFQWIAPGCQKALSQPPTLTVAASKGNLSAEKAPLDWPSAELPLTVFARPVGHFPIARHSHPLASSDDLIIVLQHLII